MRKPPWLNKTIRASDLERTARLIKGHGVHTVCTEARCPNIGECFARGEATVLILGAVCTRRCGFCNVTKGAPEVLDENEPEAVALFIEELSLTHAVITSPTRDDIPDGGARVYARTVAAVRRISPKTTVELLIPDMKGDEASLAVVASSSPDILGHNIETVPRLYSIRTGADYRRSLAVLAFIAKGFPAIRTKSAIMLGLGETAEEVRAALGDLRSAGCSFVSIGQYLSPSKAHRPVAEYITPEMFEAHAAHARSVGFAHVESAPYVRSSYHAGLYRNTDAPSAVTGPVSPGT
ncbi:MAG: lipoyl synthase [Spirochaetota bacterium]